MASNEAEQQQQQPRLVIDRMADLPAQQDVMIMPKDLTLFHGTVYRFEGTFRTHSFFSTNVNPPVGLICERTAKVTTNEKEAGTQCDPRVMALRVTRPLRLLRMKDVQTVSTLFDNDSVDGVISPDGEEEVRLNDRGLSALELVQTYRFPPSRICTFQRSMSSGTIVGADSGSVDTLYDDAYITDDLREMAERLEVEIVPVTQQNRLLSHSLLESFKDATPSALYAVLSMIRLTPGEQNLYHCIVIRDVADAPHPLLRTEWSSGSPPRLEDANRTLRAVATFAHYERGNSLTLFGFGGKDKEAERLAALTVLAYSVYAKVKISALPEDMKRMRRVLGLTGFANLSRNPTAPVNVMKAGDGLMLYDRIHPVPESFEEFLLFCAQEPLAGYGHLTALMACASTPAAQRLLWVHDSTGRDEPLSLGLAMLYKRRDVLKRVAKDLGNTEEIATEILAEAFRHLSPPSILHRVQCLMEDQAREDGLWIYRAMRVFASEGRTDKGTAESETFKAALTLCKGRATSSEACAVAFDVVGHMLESGFTECAAALMKQWHSLVARHLAAPPQPYASAEIRRYVHYFYVHSVLDASVVPNDVHLECIRHLCPPMVAMAIQKCFKRLPSQYSYGGASDNIRVSYSDTFRVWRVLKHAIENLHVDNLNDKSSSSSSATTRFFWMLLRGSSAIPTPASIRTAFVTANGASIVSYDDDVNEDIQTFLKPYEAGFNDPLFAEWLSTVQEARNKEEFSYKEMFAMALNHEDNEWISTVRSFWCRRLGCECTSLSLSLDFRCDDRDQRRYSLLRILANASSLVPRLQGDSVAYDILVSLLLRYPSHHLKNLLADDISDYRARELRALVLHVVRGRAMSGTLVTPTTEGGVVVVGKNVAEQQYNLQPLDLEALASIAVTGADRSVQYPAISVREYVHILYGPHRAPKRKASGRGRGGPAAKRSRNY